MEREFWVERWELGQILFHQGEVNPGLRELWPTLEVQPAARVLVPLCGKSLDLLWLAQQGHPVLGVELSTIACEAFFEENNLEYTVTSESRAQVYSSPATAEHAAIEIHCGDFFELSTPDLQSCGALYDRGSLVALPPEMRRRYATKICSEAPPHFVQLILCVDYDQSEMSGPPHSVQREEIDDLYGAHFEIEEARRQTVDLAPRFRDKGVTAMQDVAYRLRRCP